MTLVQSKGLMAPASQLARLASPLVFPATTLSCGLVFWWAARLLGIPFEYRHGGSLLLQPIGLLVASLLAALVLIQCLTLLTTALLASRWMFAGLAATTAGFATWSMRGGPMQQILLYAERPRIFLALAFELLLLGGIVAAAWLLLWRAHRESGSPEETPERDPGWTAVAIATVVNVIVVLMVAQTDAKQQALAAAFLGGLAATWVAESAQPDTDAGKWYWIAPIATGIFGYLVSFASGGWTNGLHLPGGTFAALSRLIPLDYASAGIFGALVGYWNHQPEPALQTEASTGLRDDDDEDEAV